MTAPVLHPRQSIGLEIARAEARVDRLRQCRCKRLCAHQEALPAALLVLQRLRMLAKNLDVALCRPLVVEVRP